MYTIKVGFSRKDMRQISAEYFKAANLNNGAQSSGNNKEQNLFLAYEYFFHLINIKTENISFIVLETRMFYKINNQFSLQSYVSIMVFNYFKLGFFTI